MIRFFVNGLPRALSVGTTVRAGGRAFQGRRGSSWASMVGLVGRQYAPASPLEGPLSLTVVFYMPRPRSAPKRVEFPLTRPDVDNLAHKLSDQWNGIFYRDDAQIVDFLVRKRFAGTGQPCGADVLVESIA